MDGWDEIPGLVEQIIRILYPTPAFRAWITPDHVSNLLSGVPYSGFGLEYLVEANNLLIWILQTTRISETGLFLSQSRSLPLAGNHSQKTGKDQEHAYNATKWAPSENLFVEKSLRRRNFVLGPNGPVGP